MQSRGKGVDVRFSLIFVGRGRKEDTNMNMPTIPTILSCVHCVPAVSGCSHQKDTRSLITCSCVRSVTLLHQELWAKGTGHLHVKSSEQNHLRHFCISPQYAAISHANVPILRSRWDSNLSKSWSALGSAATKCPN